MSTGSLLLQQLSCASRDGYLSPALAAEIKNQLTEPFKLNPVPHSTTATTMGASGGAPTLGVLGATGNFPSTTATQQQQQQQQQQPFALLGAVGEGPDALAGSLDAIKEHVARSKSMLSLLLLCGETERLTGVNEALAAIAPRAAVNIVQFIKSEISSTTLLLSGHGQTSSVFADHGKWNPILLAAQCLLLLTRHFQMQEALVRDLCGLLELLMEEVRRHIHSTAVNTASFREHPSTMGVCAVTWLVTVSLVNALAVWRDLRDASGKAKANVLLGTNIAAEVEKWVTKMREKLEHLQAFGSLSFHATGHAPGGQPKQHRANGATVRAGDAQRGRWMTIVHGFISIVVLGVGVFLCGKGDERGLDKAVEAFVGDRCQSPHALYRGKVMKRFIQFAPALSTLVIPLENIYIIPYDIASRMFDEMLPAIRHVADIDVRSCVRYLETLQTGMDTLQGDKTEAATATRTTTVTGRAGLQQHGAGMAMRERGREEPFMSEMVHILQALTVCLENLPSDVLNPDADLDCAVTHFIFTNCVLHIQETFRTQRSNILWEPYTVKLVTSFLDVLVMIGRNPRYTERVVALFSERQVDCTELQWSSLTGQAQEYAGLGGGVTSLLALDSGSSAATLGKQAGSMGSRHRQFTPEYLLAKQQAYVSSVFLLLRQIAIHPQLREQGRHHITLGVALNFFYARRLSQSVLGKVLSLIASLITNHSEASRVWTFLEENHLFRPAIGAAAHRRQNEVDTNNDMQTNEMDNRAAVTIEARSLLGHCQYECHHGTYSITIGFLDLMLTLFKYHVPEREHVATYTTVVRFIAEEIFRGVLRRFFSVNDERYIVAALAAAVLNRALSLQVAFSAKKSMIPFTIVMACSKAPSDVLGEALQMISEASEAPNELPSYQRAAVRQSLALLETGIRVKQEQGLDSVFTFDAKTASNTELAAQLLPLSASIDSLLARKALQLLLLLPQSTLSQAAQHWFGQPDAQEKVITPFVTTLRPEAVSGSVIYVPPALAVLDHDELHMMLPYAEVEIKSLIMDLLIQHARAPQLSITSWLCGYPLYGSSEELLPGYCLEPIVAGANNKDVEKAHPHIAVKYVKLLYLLHANQSLNTPGLQRLMKRRGNHEMFNALQVLQLDQCSPLILSKCAFVMKLLALDIFSIGRGALHDLSNSSNSITNSSLVELLLTLLRVSPQISFKTDEFASQSGTVVNRDFSATVDFAQWPSLCLKYLPLFPTNGMAPGGAEGYIFCTTNGTPQYSIPLLYEALQKESVTNIRRSLSVTELQERLAVFVRANECLEAYAGGVRFIEGWCSLVNISVTVFESISYERIVYLAQCIMESIRQTSSLTVAAQEQIVYELSQTFSTLMAQLKHKTTLSNSGANFSSPKHDPRELSGVALLGGNESVMDANVSVSRRALTDTTDLPQTSAITQGTKSSLIEVTNRSLRSAKRDLTGTLVVAKQEIVDGANCSLLNLESLHFLKSLLVTTVQWGSCVRMARQHFYNAIMAFLGTSGVFVDDTTLQRYYSALLDLLVQDTAAPSSSENKLSAFALLNQLLHLSPRLCEIFCMSSTGDGASPQLMTCVTSAFQAIDEFILAFFAHGGMEFSFILWFVQIVFDLLSIIAQEHAIQLVQINALSQCVSLKIWKTGARVVLGHTNNLNESSAYRSETIEVYKEAMWSVFLSTVRWFNVILPALDYSEVALLPIVEFVRTNQFLFQNALGSLFADFYRRLIGSLTLDLCAEIAGMLYHLACSPLVDELRELVHLFALPDLLVILTSGEFTEAPIFVSDATLSRLAASSQLTANQTGLPSPRQRQQISMTVQKLTQFLLRAENLVPSLDSWGKDSCGVVPGSFPAFSTSAAGGEEGAPRLRDDVRTRTLVLTITEQVVSTMERIYNSQVLQAAHFTAHLIALQSMVLLLHAFLLFDQATHTRSTNTQWGSIVHVLEEAQRVVNLWKAFHSDYRRGLKIRPTSGGHWSVAAPSISNQSIRPAIMATEPPERSVANVSTVTTSLVNTSLQKGPQWAIPSPGVEQSFTNRLSTVSLAVADGGAMPVDLTAHVNPTALDGALLPPAVDVSIGALVEARGQDEVAEDDRWRVRSARDDVLLMEFLLRQVKVAISNALRAASRT